jgi:hypothetical protein
MDIFPKPRNQTFFSELLCFACPFLESNSKYYCNEHSHFATF